MYICVRSTCYYVSSNGLLVIDSRAPFVSGEVRNCCQGTSKLLYYNYKHLDFMGV